MLWKDLMKREIINELFEYPGGGFAYKLGIMPSSRREEEILKWFFASFLYGARISEKIATKTYLEFERSECLAPQKILNTGWDGLVEILDAGVVLPISQEKIR